MFPVVKKLTEYAENQSLVYVIRDFQHLDDRHFSQQEMAFLEERLKGECRDFHLFNRYGHVLVVVKLPERKPGLALREQGRKLGADIAVVLKEHSVEEIVFVARRGDDPCVLALAEGMMLASYRFDKYKKSCDKKETFLREIGLLLPSVSDHEISHLNHIVEAVFRCRDLVNEPVNMMNALKFAGAVENMFSGSAVRVEILNKKKIESLKMGGLLAVNRGSVDPPTFTILEYKPEDAQNDKPIVLAGKGVVFDTGGLNLKTAQGMDGMKGDMAGAAAVAGVFKAVADLKMPVYLVGLLPATDNRPGNNAFAPGDIITMYNGTTVEIVNTDAEGRLILADALSYAVKYDPQLVIDIATLTASAANAVGRAAIAAMGTAGNDIMEKMVSSGFEVHERIALFPFWDDYATMIKSEVADLKNLGGREAGAITAGKFLEKFTAFPWIHLDIAGPAFLDKKDAYRGPGATGVGVRLLTQFLINYFK